MFVLVFLIKEKYKTDFTFELIVKNRLKFKG